MSTGADGVVHFMLYVGGVRWRRVSGASAGDGWSEPWSGYLGACGALVERAGGTEDPNAVTCETCRAVVVERAVEDV